MSTPEYPLFSVSWSCNNISIVLLSFPLMWLNHRYILSCHSSIDTIFCHCQGQPCNIAGRISLDTHTLPDVDSPPIFISGLEIGPNNQLLPPLASYSALSLAIYLALPVELKNWIYLSVVPPQVHPTSLLSFLPPPSWVWGLSITTFSSLPVRVCIVWLG